MLCSIKSYIELTRFRAFCHTRSDSKFLSDMGRWAKGEGLMAKGEA